MAQHVGQRIGYARVSSTDQNLDRQLTALGEVNRVFEEKLSGAKVLIGARHPGVPDSLPYMLRHT